MEVYSIGPPVFSCYPLSHTLPWATWWSIPIERHLQHFSHPKLLPCVATWVK